MAVFHFGMRLFFNKLLCISSPAAKNWKKTLYCFTEKGGLSDKHNAFLEMYIGKAQLLIEKAPEDCNCLNVTGQK